MLWRRGRELRKERSGAPLPEAMDRYRPSQESDDIFAEYTVCDTTAESGNETQLASDFC